MGGVCSVVLCVVQPSFVSVDVEKWRDEVDSGDEGGLKGDVRERGGEGRGGERRRGVGRREERGRRGKERRRVRRKERWVFTRTASLHAVAAVTDSVRAHLGCHGHPAGCG